MNFISRWRERKARKLELLEAEKELSAIRTRYMEAKEENFLAEAHMDYVAARIHGVCLHYARWAEPNYPLFQDLLLLTQPEPEEPGRLMFRTDDPLSGSDLSEYPVAVRDLFNTTVDLANVLVPQLFDAYLRVELADATLDFLRKNRNRSYERVSELTFLAR